MFVSLCVCVLFGWKDETGWGDGEVKRLRQDFATSTSNPKSSDVTISTWSLLGGKPSLSPVYQSQASRCLDHLRNQAWTYFLGEILVGNREITSEQLVR